MKYYSREIEGVLKRAAGQFRVLALTGMRQTGKSTLLNYLFKKTHHYVSLDNPRDLKLAQDDPELFFDEYKAPLIIDEIQYAPQLLPYIKMRVDKSSKRGQFILTGSQQFTMSRNLRETLAGRVAIFHLLPMAITEAKAATQSYSFRAINGSYPELIVRPSHDPQRWFGSYVATYIEKDIQPFYRLEKITYFRNLLFLLAARTSQVLNYQSLANDLGVSIQAVKLWINILEVSQVIFLLRPYHINLGSRIVKSPKVYFTDIGLVNYLIGNKLKAALTRGLQAGAIFENFVVQELLKHYYNLGLNPPIYYYRTNNGLEVDIIIEERTGVLRPCEVKLSKTPNSGMLNSIERFRSLSKSKKLTVLDGCLISLVEKSFPITKTARAYNLKEFLSLSKNPSK
ncbi:MAG: ATP-binding protein [Candidatus Omnitrophica bacterium]|nr:ATP-binding protein [Candidatus Omnitrophota bacterium]